MAKRYTNCPIREALCEFQFEQDSSWDLAMPGLIFEQIREQFPKKRQVKAPDMQICVGAQRVTPEVPILMDRIQFLQEDEKALLQVGPRLLAVNVLSPYPGWDSFRPMILDALKVYRRVVDPAKLHRVVLRYINVIKTTEARIDLQEYFNFYPYLGSGLPQEHGRFICGVRVPRDSVNSTLKIELASVPQPTTLAFTLDLEHSLSRPEALGFDVLPDWLDVAHSDIEGIFEACLTEKLRSLFEEMT